MSPPLKQINWLNLPAWAYKTAGSDWLLYTRKKRPLSFERMGRFFFPRLEKPIFVVGAPRSGTTFLGACLGEIPEISYHFEPVATKAAVRYVAEGTWSHRKAAWFFRNVYKWLLRLHLAGDLRFSEKTPRNALIIPFLAEAFPSAQFVHIIRDGRDTALSLSKKPWLLEKSKDTGRYEPGGYPIGPYPWFWVEPDRREEYETTSDIRRCTWAWRVHTLAALEAGAQLSPERYHELRYEELVAKPKDEADRLLEFLGIDAPASREAMHGAVSKAKQSSVGRGVKELNREQIGDVLAEAGELLEQLGYLGRDEAAAVQRDEG